MKIYSTKDRIKIAIDDMTVAFAPLTFGQKKEIQSLLIQAKKTGNDELYMDAAALAMRYSVKSVEGLEKQDGTKYDLVFQGDGLSDCSIDDLLNLEVSSRLTAICLDLVNGISNEIINPLTGKVMEGVKIVNPLKRGKG